MKKILSDPHIIKGTVLFFQRKPVGGIPATNTMTQKKQPIKKGTKKAKRPILGYQLPRYIKPADTAQRITLGAGCEAFLTGHDGEYPQELSDKFRLVEAAAIRLGQDQARQNQVMGPLPSPEETAKELINVLRQYGDKERNKVVALVLYGIEKEMKLKKKQFEGNLDKAQHDLQSMTAIADGFEKIRSGDFESLNIL